ncbi:hypothetical protein A7J58_01870 [Enterobacter cloacae]|uniref:Transposase n=1 Tax=Enterobacter genomosp. S TaxID=2364151 RepID=A0ABR5YKI9_9ENTR|nr:hypothetical protein A3466_05475 [Enterobacter genomosp. S]OAE43013.1 hypothetical protein A7J56_01855 [Enterobacter cloacae]OAE69266.1 hypothetical protein A7J58_01870 [Enterobacter cloacae]OAZ43208.1 hypothetical protein A9Z41_15695 [Enterobacter cloacae]
MAPGIINKAGHNLPTLAIFITVPLAPLRVFRMAFCSGGQVLHRFLPGQAILSNLQNSRVIITTVMTQSISYG